MAFNLSNLVQAIYTELGQLTASTATGGSTTTAVDSKLQGQYGDDDWKDGALFVIRDAAGAGAAPEGEFSRISAYDDDGSDGTFTIDSLTAAIASGDTFGFVNAYYPLHSMIELVNAALRALGDIALVDTTTLDTESSKTEYAAAVAWKRRRPLAVDIQGKTGDGNDNRWVRVYDWDFVPAAPGSTGLIIFKSQPTSSRDIRVWYKDAHPRLSDYDDVVSETITPELAVAVGVERALRWQNSRAGGGDPFLLERWNDAKVELERAKTAFPVWTPRRSAKLMIIGDTT
ncbi:MAG: hypothetical protein FVQ83_14895 [Chloroflexi bacterium]|nr:hypothetical protein [Chloroflexota bacterium]